MHDARRVPLQPSQDGECPTDSDDRLGGVSYEDVRERMAAAAERVGRDLSAIRLVAVSKAKSVTDIEKIYSLGHRDFGENRAQEMVEKAAVLPDDIRWHFVGGLQTNKARAIRPITST